MSEAVARQLETELGLRGLLLTADRLAAAEAEASELGAQLLRRLVHVCYPISRQGGEAVTLEFDSERAAARIEGALAFGGVTGRMLMRPAHNSGRRADSIELACATFNLGIGLVDGLCDENAAVGGALLELMGGQDLEAAVEEPRRRGWLRSRLPAPLARDPTVAFTAGIVESFFELLHQVYPADEWLPLRRSVGAKLAAALEAERQSVAGSEDQLGRQLLIECSRSTSVLPFEVIETLAADDYAASAPAAGTALGEAMWRIDDLVDLYQDACSGSLNGLLLAVAPGVGRPQDGELFAVLESVLASTAIALAASEAAEKLLAGLQHIGRGGDTLDDHARAAPFVYFVQRYVGIAPRQPS